LQRALRDLGLVGSVAGQEFRALDQVIHRRRDVVLIGAGADEEGNGGGGGVFAGHLAEDALDLELALGAGQVDRGLQQLAGRHIAEQRVDIGDADPREHVLAVGIGEREIAHGVIPFRGVIPCALRHGMPRRRHGTVRREGALS
jgi:hypothetical protein